jgi:diaminopimelate decarboxylase
VNDLGHITFDGVDLAKAAEKYGTPQYIFSERQITRNYLRIKQAFESLYRKETMVAYAIKANPIPEILSSLARLGAMFEASSLGEIYLIRQMGIKTEKAVFTSIYKPEEALRFLMRDGNGLIVIDSMSDLRRINSIAQETGQSISVLIRVNPCIESLRSVFSASSPNSKVGVPADYANTKSEDTAWKLLEAALSSDNLSLEGIHGHIGSQIVDIDLFRAFAKRLSVFMAEAENRMNFKTHILDLGGGFPIQYDSGIRVPSVESIAMALISEIRNPGFDPTLIVEPGRYIVGNAGVLLTHVVGVKNLPNLGKIAIIDASAYNELLDAILVQWFFDIQVANKATSDDCENVRVVGVTNDTLDHFCQSSSKVEPKPEEGSTQVGTRKLPKLQEGDTLVIKDVGAYSVSFNMNYCMMPKPQIFIIKTDNTFCLARKKESLEDLLSLWVL